jgi:cysteinyl-tRNA synthetase
MIDATAGLDRLYECMAAIDDLNTAEIAKDTPVAASAKDSQKLATIEERFQKVMDDDFNTAQALAILFDAVKVINKICQHLPARPCQGDLDLIRSSGAVIKKLAGIMGLLKENAGSYLRQKQSALLEDLEISEADIVQLIQERKDARAAKDWARGDTIRDHLLANGIELKDGAEGTSWKIKGR